jgi:hypothetical protein
MTRTIPRRRTILQRSQIRFTELLTFIAVSIPKESPQTYLCGSSLSTLFLLT